MQADYITGAKEAIPYLDPRASEFSMKQKVWGRCLQSFEVTSFNGGKTNALSLWYGPF